MEKRISKYVMGLDDDTMKCFNQIMNWEYNAEKIWKYAKSLVVGMYPEKKIRQSPKDIEVNALRDNMRGQFQKLRDKGLSISIVTL